MDYGKIIGFVVLNILAIIALPLIFLLLRKTKAGSKIKPLWFQLIIGVIFGGLAILSTHSGLDVNGAIINARDALPLTAGLIFGPVAGIVSGFIGGFERLMVGLFANVGAYSAIACSISCLLAGLVGAGVFYLYKKKNKNVTCLLALILGLSIEIIHMVLIIVFKANDAQYAWNNVVSIISAPIIISVALGSSGAVLFTNLLKKYIPTIN